MLGKGTPESEEDSIELDEFDSDEQAEDPLREFHEFEELEPAGVVYGTPDLVTHNTEKDDFYYQGQYYQVERLQPK